MARSSITFSTFSRHERATRRTRLHAARYDVNASMMMVVKIFTWMSHLRSQSGAGILLTYDLHLHDLLKSSHLHDLLKSSLRYRNHQTTSLRLIHPLPT